MMEAMVATPLCTVCRRPATHVELVPPGKRPSGWLRRSWKWRAGFKERRRLHPSGWWLLFTPVYGTVDFGYAVKDHDAERIHAAFAEPHRYNLVVTAGFYDDAGMCGPCDAFYCPTHWNISSTGFGLCLHGHGKSLNPYRD